jgi:hypothetical protein
MRLTQCFQVCVVLPLSPLVDTCVMLTAGLCGCAACMHGHRPPWQQIVYIHYIVSSPMPGQACGQAQGSVIPSRVHNSMCMPLCVHRHGGLCSQVGVQLSLMFVRCMSLDCYLGMGSR